MKEFTTITHKQILYEAYENILSKFCKENDRNEAFNKQHGRNNSISAHRIEIYNKQLEELHEAILECERWEQKGL